MLAAERFVSINTPVPDTVFGTMSLNYFEKSEIAPLHQKHLHQFHSRCQVQFRVCAIRVPGMERPGD
jgi:hypothetical protein